MRNKNTCFNIVIILIFLFFLTIGCGKKSSKHSSSQSEKTPYAVYIYDGTKEIVLYNNPKTASVDGKSGSWIDTNWIRMNGEIMEYPTYYIVWYGEKTCVIAPGSGLVYFGSEEEAKRNVEDESKWKDCRKKRL